MRDPTGKIAVITGASSGIGEATARLLMEEGAHVTLTARRVERLQKLAAELGDSATVMQLDVSDAAPVARTFTTLGKRFGGIDLLFNNAGLGISSSFESSDPADWKSMIDANLYGVLNSTQASSPLMRGRAGAMI